MLELHVLRALVTHPFADFWEQAPRCRMHDNHKEVDMPEKPRIAHFAGPNATIMNTPPLVTSNKARVKYGLPLRANHDGSPSRFDVLRPQQLAKPVTVYVRQYSAHPLERDAAELYGPPDGYLDRDGVFHPQRQDADDVPVFEIELRPEDGLYPLPYMARKADGKAWESECAGPDVPPDRCRQHYFPDGHRFFEEIDRLSVGPDGWGNLIASRATVDFYRVLPPAGYKKGLSERERTDLGQGDIEPEVLGRHFFPYKPYRFGESPPRPALAQITNAVQRALSSGDYVGAIWTQGSPRIEETMYWFNLLLDTTLPICGNCAQRPHGEVSNDGPKNIVDSVEYITSRVWADEQGRNQMGAVMIQEQRIFSAREVQKGDARPGGTVATGGHGGIVGAVGHGGPPVITFLPSALNTYRSAVNFTRMPDVVTGASRLDGRYVQVDVQIKDQNGNLLESAIPKVTIVKDGSYTADHFESDPEWQVDIIAQIEQSLTHFPLSGFVIEGLSPYGLMTSRVRQQIMRRAAASGMPVVRVGRGNNEGFTAPADMILGGRNLTATKARILLMACLMRFGSPPPAADPELPTEDERRAIRRCLEQYQKVLDTH